MPCIAKQPPMVNVSINRVDGKYRYIKFTINTGNHNKFAVQMIESFLHGLRQCEMNDIARTITGYIKK
jgi:hypothetical protein